MSELINVMVYCGAGTGNRTEETIEIEASGSAETIWEEVRAFAIDSTGFEYAACVIGDDGSETPLDDWLMARDGVLFVGPKSLSSLQSEVHAWHVETFGETTDRLICNIGKKIGEEIEEYSLAEVGSLEELEAMADVMIAMMALAGRFGYSLESAIETKLAVLKSPDRNRIQRDKERGIGS